MISRELRGRLEELALLGARAAFVRLSEELELHRAVQPLKPVLHLGGGLAGEEPARAMMLPAGRRATLICVKSQGELRRHHVSFSGPL
jgi:hypothetical protein